MMSLKNKPKITFNAPVVLGFAMICLLATIANMITAGGSNRLLFSTYRSSLFSPLTYLRLFTHVFGHSGWAHLVGNMAYILLLGPMLEEKYGSVRLVVVMAVTALVTGLINNLLFGNVALCGASGIVFAFILLTSFTSFKEGEIRDHGERQYLEPVPYPGRHRRRRCRICPEPETLNVKSI